MLKRALLLLICFKICIACVTAQSISADIFDPFTGGDYYDFSANYPIENKYATIDYRLFDSIIKNNYVTYYFDSIGRIIKIQERSYLGWNLKLFSYSSKNLIEVIEISPNFKFDEFRVSYEDTTLLQTRFNYSQTGELESIIKYRNGVIKEQIVFKTSHNSDTLNIDVEKIYFDKTGNFDFSRYEKFEIFNDRIMRFSLENSFEDYVYQGDSILVLKGYQNETGTNTFIRFLEYRFNAFGKLTYENGYQYFYLKDGKLKNRISSSGKLVFKYNRFGVPKKIIHKTSESKVTDRFNYYFR